MVGRAGDSPPYLCADNEYDYEYDYECDYELDAALEGGNPLPPSADATDCVPPERNKEFKEFKGI